MMRSGFTALAWIALLFGADARATSAESFRLLTLNLHGYHAKGEPSRLSEDRSGSIRETQSSPFYFTLEELARGESRRQEKLAADLASARPDIVFLQEVAAGLPNTIKNCHEFDARPDSDAFGTNTAWRLARRIAQRGLSYQYLSACRGNVGWFTGAQDLAERRIARRLANGDKEVVFDFGSSPYPSGLLVEGTAMLVAPGWKVLAAEAFQIPIAGTDAENFFGQVAALSPPGSRGWIIAANLHAGHKLRHFEQAVATREKLEEWKRAVRRKIDDSGGVEGEFQGFLVVGDLNSTLYRPAPGLPHGGVSGEDSEISSVPWEVSKAGAFDYSHAGSEAPRWREELARKLLVLDADSSYKPWATLGGSSASRRAWAAVDRYSRLLADGARPLREAHDRGIELGRCGGPADLQPSCSIRHRIDHVLADPKWDILRSSVIYSENDWNSTDGVSDHPGLLIDFARPQ